MKKRHVKLFENYSRNYTRVIPRDFFNEAKLLKCMGILALAVLDGQIPQNIDITIDENGDPFNILLDDTWSLLYVSNYDVEINGEIYMVGTRYNSKGNFPFYVLADDEEIEILDNNGKFSREFIEKFTQDNSDE